MNDPDYVAALNREAHGYVARGNDEGLKAVNAELKRLGEPAYSVESKTKATKSIAELGVKAIREIAAARDGFKLADDADVAKADKDVLLAALKADGVDIDAPHEG